MFPPGAYPLEDKFIAVAPGAEQQEATQSTEHIPSLHVLFSCHLVHHCPNPDASRLSTDLPHFLQACLKVALDGIVPLAPQA
jgi:hypothetical protein